MKTPPTVYTHYTHFVTNNICTLEELGIRIRGSEIDLKDLELTYSLAAAPGDLKTRRP